jgi:hypothetical protein
VLRSEAIVHNTKQLRCGRVLDRFGEIVGRLAGMVDRFCTTLDCLDIGFLPEDTARAANPEYRRMEGQLAYRRHRGDHVTVAELRRKMRSTPSINTADSGFRRLRYVRYCDFRLMPCTYLG